MTSTKQISLLCMSAFIVAGCDTAPPPTGNATSVDGMSFQEMRREYNDLSAIEFAVIDTNNDNIVDADEEAAIDITIDDD